MKKIFLIAGAVCATSLIPNEALAFSFSKVYAFGDSLVDTGNVFTTTSGAIPPAPLYNQGRFSNGPIWLDYLTEYLGVNTTPVMQLSPGTIPTDGINFAYGGATTGLINTLDPLLPIPALLGLKEQVSWFDALIPDGTLADADALYVIWAGSNDYLPSTTAGPGFIPALTPDVPVSNLSDAIQSIYGQGGRNFLVANLPDLGNNPFILQNPALSGFSSVFNQRVEAFNSALNSQLGYLNSVLSGVNITSFDANSFLDQILANNTLFLNVTQPCFNQVTRTVCSNPNDYLFWDFNHPSAKAQQVLGEAVIATLQEELDSKSVPESDSILGVILFGILGLFSSRFAKPK